MTDFTLAAQRPALLKGFDNEFHILAKLKAPEQPEDTRERKPLNLSIVIDRLRESELMSHIHLPRGERSKLATLASRSL